MDNQCCFRLASSGQQASYLPGSDYTDRLSRVDNLQQTIYTIRAPRNRFRLRIAGALGDLHQMVEADLAFHQAIVDIAGNRYARQIWETLSRRIRTYFYRNDAHYANLAFVADEHVPLLEAPHGKNVEHAVAAPASPGTSLRRQKTRKR